MTDKKLNFNHQKKVGIIAVNSPDFAQKAFNCFQQNQIVVFLQNPSDDYKIQAAGITTILTPESGCGWSQPSFIAQDKDAIAQIAFTSGTTGKPKGVILKHTALNDVVQRLNDIMEVDSSIREYIGIPVNYSFGFGRCRAVVTAGGQFYIPENGFNPLEIREMLQEGSINAISAVPSLWRSLFQCKEMFGSETEAIKWIEIGSQYMSRKEKEELIQLFPNAKIVQHYGLTEASRTTFLRIDQTQGETLESVGKTYGKTEIKISDDHRIMIRGPHVAEQLLIDDELKDNINVEQWHTTNDLGEIKDGYLYYLGRADDLINCAGIKISPDAFERSLRERLNLHSGITVVKINDPIRGEAILVATLAELSLNLLTVKQAAYSISNQYGINSEDAIKFMDLQEFPTTATGKIQRKEIAKLYHQDQEKRQTQHLTQNSEVEATLNQDLLLSEKEKTILSIWQDVLNVSEISVDSNFFQLGGDSLTAITAMFKMERQGIPKEVIRGILQGLTIREIARRMESSEEVEDSGHTITNAYTRMGMSINIIRGILVLCVISGHWSDGLFNRIFSSLGGIKLIFESILASVFAAGTPGFAIIYGVSVGYSLFKMFKTDRKRLLKITSTTSSFLCIGIALLAFFSFGEQYLLGEVTSFTNFTNSFYSVLSYYLLITLTLPFWLWLLNKSKYPAFYAIFYGIILYLLYYYIFKGFTQYPQQGWLELAKLLISAKYSYFNLTAGTLSGISIGIILRSRIDRGEGKIPNSFIWSGLSCVTAGLAICLGTGMSKFLFQWPQPSPLMWTWLLYIGVILILLVLVHKFLLNYKQLFAPFKYCLQFLSIIGILAFPSFVLHAIVLPLKVFFVKLFGLPSSLSIILAVFLFLVSMSFLFKKIYRANFS